MYASANLDVGIGASCEDAAFEWTVGAEKVGNFTDVSWWKVSMSSGEDLIGMARTE